MKHIVNSICWRMENEHEIFLSYAIEQAAKSRSEGGIPIGAGKVI
jgi:hypothetical protein